MSGEFIPSDPATLTFAQLQEQVGEWARRNFPNNTPNDPFEGIVEELGELAHARLKARQGIRGTREEHEAKERDAIGDIAIYLADWCERNGVCMAAAAADAHDGNEFVSGGAFTLSQLEDETREAREVDAEILSTAGAFRQLVRYVGDLSYALSYDRDDDYEEESRFEIVGWIVLTLTSYCLARGFSFAQIVAETWDHVRKRDWQKNATTGQVA